MIVSERKCQTEISIIRNFELRWALTNWLDHKSVLILSIHWIPREPDALQLCTRKRRCSAPTLYCVIYNKNERKSHVQLQTHSTCTVCTVYDQQSRFKKVSGVRQNSNLPDGLLVESSRVEQNKITVRAQTKVKATRERCGWYSFQRAQVELPVYYMASSRPGRALSASFRVSGRRLIRTPLFRAHEFPVTCLHCTGQRQCTAQ